MSTVNRIIKNTLFLYIRMGVSIIFSFFTTRILLQALGASDYGLYNVVAGALSMLGFLSGSLSTATQRFISYAEGEGCIERIKKIFDNSILLHRIIAGIACIVFLLAGLIFFNGVLNIPEERFNVAILVYGCMIFSTIFSITIVPYESVINAHENMLFYSILGIFDVTLKLIIAIAVSYSSFDQLLFYAILMAVESWFFRCVTAWYCKRKYHEVRNIDIYSNKDKTIIKDMASFAGWNVLNIFSGMICLYGLSIIVNHYYGTVTNAALGVATQLSGVLMGLTQNMSKALTPVIVKNEGSGDRNQMIKISLKGCRFSYLVFCFVSLPICFALKPILSLWLKDVPEYTFEFCIIMLISELVEQAYLILSHSISAEGNIKGYCIWRTIANLIALPVTIIVFHYGTLPTASWIVRFFTFVLIGWVVTIVYSKINLGMKLKDYYHEVLRPCALFTILSLFMFIPISILINNFIANTIVLYLISVPLLWFSGFNGNERKLVANNVLKHRKNTL